MCIPSKVGFSVFCEKIKDKFNVREGYFASVNEIYNKKVEDVLKKGTIGDECFVPEYEHFRRYYFLCNEHENEISENNCDENGVVNYLSPQTIKEILKLDTKNTNQDTVIKVADEILKNVITEITDNTDLAPTYWAMRNCKDINAFEKILNDINNTIQKEFEETRDTITKSKEEIIDAINRKNVFNNKIITTSSPSGTSTVFIGRENDIEDIKEKAKTKKVVLMNGMGGIGKTEICRHLFWYYCDNAVDGVEYIGWINYHDNLKNSLLGNFKGVEEKDSTKYIQAVKSRIDELGNKLLLFVDNANDISDREAAELSGLACRIIMTSRKNRITSFHPFEVKKLPPEKCLEIYQKYSKDNSRESVEYIEKILILADYHTQTVELLAKTQKSSDLTAEELHKMLIDNGFSLAGISEKVDGRHGNDVTNEIFIEHLAKIFDITTITPDEKLLEALRLFSLHAPNEPIRKRVLKNWFSLDNLNPVNELIAKGWLKEDENNEISIHPVISEVVRYKYPAEFEFAQELVNKIIDELKYSIEKGSGISVWNKLITHSVAVAKSFNKSEHKDYATLLNNIGIVYNKICDYNKALEFYEKALNIVKNILGELHPYTATSYNNIGSVYDKIGDYNKALEFYEKALNVKIKLLGTEHPSTATSYNNIGGVYDSMGNYNKALEFYEKALNIREKVLGELHPYTATSYNNIGSTYYSMGDYNKALEYINKTKDIFEKVLGEKHPNTKIIYGNLAAIYIEIGDEKKAREYYLKSI